MGPLPDHPGYFEEPVTTVCDGQGMSSVAACCWPFNAAPFIASRRYAATIGYLEGAERRKPHRHWPRLRRSRLYGGFHARPQEACRYQDRRRSVGHARGTRVRAGACRITIQVVPTSHLKLKRVYEPAAPSDGRRIPADRLWPRGLRKTDAAVDRWFRDIAPSTEFRRWFGHDPLGWPEFRCCYVKEPQEHAALLDEIHHVAEQGTLTLLFCARDDEHNDAVVLKEALLQRHEDNPSCGRTPA